jgi:hypothetical protein
MKYNPILAVGEFAMEILPSGGYKLKLGNGSSAWSDLEYFTGGGSGSGFKNISFPIEGGARVDFATAADAIASVIYVDRAASQGLVFFNTAVENWQIWLYHGTDSEDTNWLDSSNWENVSTWTDIPEVVTAVDIQQVSTNLARVAQTRVKPGSKKTSTHDLFFTGSNGITLELDSYTNKPLIKIQNDINLVRALNYFKTPTYSKVYHVYPDSPHELENGSEEYPYKTWTKLLIEHSGEAGVKVLWHNFVNPPAITSLPFLATEVDGWTFGSYGAEHAVIDIGNITATGLTFENLRIYGNINVSGTNPNPRFRNCEILGLFTVNTAGLVSFNHCQLPGRIDIESSATVALAYSEVEKLIVNGGGSVIAYETIIRPFGAEPYAIVANTTGNILLLSGSILKPDGSLAPVNITNVNDISFGITSFERAGSVITSTNPEVVRGLSAHQVTDEDISRFHTLQTLSSSQDDINTAIDDELRVSRFHQYDGIYYIDGTTTEATGFQTGSYAHPWKTWNQATAALTGRTNILIFLHNASTQDVEISGESNWTIASIVGVKDQAQVAIQNLNVAGSANISIIGVNVQGLTTISANALEVYFEGCSFAQPVTNRSVSRVVFKDSEFEANVILAGSAASVTVIDDASFTDNALLDIQNGKNIISNGLNVSLQQLAGTTIVSGSTILATSPNLVPANTFGAVVTGGSIFFENNGDNGSPVAISITGASTVYGLGRLSYNAATSVIDPNATEVQNSLQARQIKDLFTDWEIIQPESNRQSDINKALDATIALINRVGSNRGTVLSAYEAQTAWVVESASVEIGSTYTTDQVSVDVSGVGYVDGDRVSIGYGTAYEVVTDNAGGVNIVTIANTGVSVADIAGPLTPTGGTGTGAVLNVATDQCVIMNQFAVNDAGTGYVAGDQVAIPGNVRQGIVTIDTVGGAGQVLTFTYTQKAVATGIWGGPVVETNTLSGVGSGFNLASWATVDAYYVVGVTIDTAGAGYSLLEHLVDAATGLNVIITQLNNTVVQVIVDEPGLALGDFSDSAIPAQGGSGTGLTLNVLTIQSTLPTLGGYNVGDVVLVRTPTWQTIAQAHLVVTAVDNIGIPTAFDITEVGAYENDVTGVYLTGTSGPGAPMFVTITTKEEEGDTLRRYLLPPRGTATDATKARPGDVVKVLRDENFGGISRNYVYADYNGDGTYNFVPQQGTIGDRVYTGDGDYIEIDEEYIITLTAKIKTKVDHAVQNIGDEIINGQKTFTTSPLVPSKIAEPVKTAETSLVTEAQLVYFTEVIDGGDWDA